MRKRTSEKEVKALTAMVELLRPLSTEQRRRVFDAAMTLLPQKENLVTHAQ